MNSSPHTTTDTFTRDTLMEQASILVENVTRDYAGYRNLIETLAALPPANALAIVIAIMTELEHVDDGLPLRAMLLTASLDAATATKVRS